MSRVHEAAAPPREWTLEGRWPGVGLPKLRASFRARSGLAAPTVRAAALGAAGRLATRDARLLSRSNARPCQFDDAGSSRAGGARRGSRPYRIGIEERAAQACSTGCASSTGGAVERAFGSRSRRIVSDSQRPELMKGRPRRGVPHAPARSRRLARRCPRGRFVAGSERASPVPTASVGAKRRR